MSGRYDAACDRLSLSYTRYKTARLGAVGRGCVRLCEVLRLVAVRRGVGEDGAFTDCSNMTIINLVLRWAGPTHESTLAIYLLIFQVSPASLVVSGLTKVYTCAVVVLLSIAFG